MEQEELIPITVWLAGRSYRLRIKASEEEMVRKAAKIADDKITDLRNHYAGKDDQDFVAMCLLTYAADGVTEDSSPLVQKDINDMLQKIDAAINK
ncbi:MAG: cell division protein ZapA [Bacteroidetes bacterium]|nr:cell division protein ZapA [Bacteroidota bacterium]